MLHNLNSNKANGKKGIDFWINTRASCVYWHINADNILRHPKMDLKPIKWDDGSIYDNLSARFKTLQTLKRI